jgi:hypothetical protein
LRKKKARRAFFPCPACGEPVREGSLACKACGSDERAGWRDDVHDGLDLPAAMDDGEYEDFVEAELGGGARGRAARAPRSGLPLRTRVVGLALAALLLAGALLLLW